MYPFSVLKLMCTIFSKDVHEACSFAIWTTLQLCQVDVSSKWHRNSLSESKISKLNTQVTKVFSFNTQSGDLQTSYRIIHKALELSPNHLHSTQLFNKLKQHFLQIQWTEITLQFLKVRSSSSETLSVSPINCSFLFLRSANNE